MISLPDSGISCRSLLHARSGLLTDAIVISIAAKLSQLTSLKLDENQLTAESAITIFVDRVLSMTPHLSLSPGMRAFETFNVPQEASTQTWKMSTPPALRDLEGVMLLC